MAPPPPPLRPHRTLLAAIVLLGVLGDDVLQLSLDFDFEGELSKRTVALRRGDLANQTATIGDWLRANRGVHSPACRQPAAPERHECLARELMAALRLPADEADAVIAHSRR